MPEYLFQNPITQEIRSIFFKMNDNKKFSTEDGEWIRLYTVPNASIDVKLDPRSRNDFIRRTEKYSTLGDLMDCSKELSEKREQKDGVDSIKKEFFDQYSKTRNGAKHPDDMPKKVENKYATVDLTKG
jgi:hypothetical protein